MPPPPNTVFPSTAPAAWPFRVAFGAVINNQGQSGAGAVVTAAAPVYILNLISCAAAVYIYTNGGLVVGAAVFHAHTGDIPLPHAPTAGVYNVLGRPPADIHVVFASSQSMHANPNSGIQTAADGLYTILGVGVPLGNIRVVTGTSVFGCNHLGDVGRIVERYWANGNLQIVLNTVLANASVNFLAGFGPVLIPPHGLVAGNGLLNNLNLALNNAQDDTQRLTAMTNFFNGPGNFAAGSAKLHVVTELRLNIPLALAILPVPTPATAAAMATNIINGITGGIY